LIAQPAGTGDDVEDAFTRGLGGDAAGRRQEHIIDLTDDSNEGGVLRHESHNDLRLDRAILDPVDDLLFDFCWGLARRRHKSRVGDRNVSLGIDWLVRQRDEVARTHARFCRNKKTARSRLKDADADYVANTELDLRRRPTIAKNALGIFRPDLVKAWHQGRRKRHRAVRRSVPSSFGPNDNGVGTGGCY